MKRIALSSTRREARAFALVDDEDFDRVGAFAWTLHAKGYAYRWLPGRPRRCVLLHREILGLAHGDRRQGDHVNGDRLDCRRENLRVVTHAGNTQNVRARGGSSRFRGVRWHGASRRWAAVVNFRRRAYWVGTFADELVAAIAAEQKRRELMPLAGPDPELAKALAAS